MQARLTTKPVHDVVAAVDALNLESVKVRLMDAELGKGWGREYADSVEGAYKTYLTMLAKHQDHAEDILLSKDVDEFWHTHILQTMKYADDCDRVFGTYLHHNPHIGARTAADLEKRRIQAEMTRRLYEGEFGGVGQSRAAWAGRAAVEGVRALPDVSVAVQGAAFSSAAIRGEQAAFSSAAVRAQNAAFSSAAVRAENAAFSSAAIKPEQAAFSSAAVRAENAAFSSAAIKAEQAAFSSAAVRAENAAFSSAAIRAEQAAFSSAAVRAENAAFSSAAIRPEQAAFSSAAVRAENAAFSSAAIGAEQAAFSSAAIKPEQAAFSSAAVRLESPQTLLPVR